MSYRKLFIAAYDIRDPKRLEKIHRLLIKAGLPVQYSVFTVVFNKGKLKQLLASIEGVIDER